MNEYSVHFRIQNNTASDGYDQGHKGWPWLEAPARGQMVSRQRLQDLSGAWPCMYIFDGQYNCMGNVHSGQLLTQ